MILFNANGQLPKGQTQSIPLLQFRHLMFFCCQGLKRAILAICWRLLLAYDSDHIHLNEAGYQAVQSLTRNF
jgi:hypothetical protein